jgi:ubiquinol-cytochrome c reductase cytochrome b subunit
MIERFALWIDDRLGTAHWVRKALRKAFPDHWSFMLGEINMYAFVLLVVTGTFLALFFRPDATETMYHGPYATLDGSRVSEAYQSTLALSFQVNAGLLVRQIHHWLALIFLAGIVVHMMRIFFTGAFRKPRELNWLIGIGLFVLAMGEGFTGYSLPDDLLSGTGLRIADSVVLSIPFVGTWLSSLILDGAVFPSDQLIPRLFTAHVFILPATIAALIAVHLAILWRQKHSQFPGPGRTEHNVVGSPLFPNYAAKSIALFAAIVAVSVGLGAFVQINPIWLWGPYEPWRASSPAQPDWYIGWLEGALRIGPPWALHLWGHTIPSPFWPSVLMPIVLLAVVACAPWIDAKLRGDHEAHQLLDPARAVPMRTAAGVAFLVFTGGLTLAGSDDVQARYFHTDVTSIVHFYQGLCTLGVAFAFVVAYLVASELRERGRERQPKRVRIRRNDHGGYEEEELS